MGYDFNSLIRQQNEANNRDKFYTDFEDVDPNVFHQIEELTKWMRTKGKGSDVREVIAQLFERTWLENIKKGNANMEVAKARGASSTLADRLNAIEGISATGLQNAQALDQSKVDKNGAGQITYEMLAQDVRQKMTGGSTAVVGANAVSTVNIVNGSVTNEKLKGPAIQVHFLPDMTLNCVELDTKAQTLDFGQDANIYYNGKYLKIKGPVIDLKNSFTNTAGVILINLNTGIVSAQSLSTALPDNAAILGVVRRYKNKYTFTGAIADAIIENGRLPKSSYISGEKAVIYPSTKCLMSFDYSTKSISFISGGFIPVMGNLHGADINTTIKFADEDTSGATLFFKLAYNFKTEEAKIFGRTFELPKDCRVVK